MHQVGTSLYLYSFQLTDKQCTWLHTNSVGPQPQHLGHYTTCGSETTCIYKNSWRWTCKCPKHVEAIYENKIIVKLFASSWYISLLAVILVVCWCWRFPRCERASPYELRLSLFLALAWRFRSYVEINMCFKADHSLSNVQFLENVDVRSISYRSVRNPRWSGVGSLNRHVLYCWLWIMRHLFLDPSAVVGILWTAKVSL